MLCDEHIICLHTVHAWRTHYASGSSCLNATAVRTRPSRTEGPRSTSKQRKKDQCVDDPLAAKDAELGVLRPELDCLQVENESLRTQLGAAHDNLLALSAKDLARAARKEGYMTAQKRIANCHASWPQGQLFHSFLLPMFPSLFLVAYVPFLSFVVDAIVHQVCIFPNFSSHSP